MKKKILILGNSSFFQKRVFPSLKKIANLDIIICSKSNKINKNKNIYFNDYDKALNGFSYDLVYISLINPFHFPIAKKAIKLGFNVIIDKPITLKFDHTKKLIKLAKDNNVLLSEFTIFNLHRIFDKIERLIGGYKNIELIVSNFNIPLKKKIKNYYLKKNDCLEDMSPYASSIIRIFLGGKIQKYLVKKKSLQGNSNIIKEFTVFAYNNKTHYIGNFGIDKEYESKIKIYCKKKIISIPFKAFALPSGKKISISIKEKNKIKKIKLSDDYIKRIFENYLKLKKSKKYYLNKIIIDNNIKKDLKLFK